MTHLPMTLLPMRRRHPLRLAALTIGLMLTSGAAQAQLTPDGKQNVPGGTESRPSGGPQPFTDRRPSPPADGATRGFTPPPAAAPRPAAPSPMDRAIADAMTAAKRAEDLAKANPANAGIAASAKAATAAATEARAAAMQYDTIRVTAPGPAPADTLKRESDLASAVERAQAAAKAATAAADSAMAASTKK